MSRYTLLSILVGLAAVVPAPAIAQVTTETQPTIVTEGHAVLKRAPDQAFVTIAAETRAQTPAQAQGLAAEAMTSVHAALMAAGIEEGAIRTTGYSLQPDMQYDEGRARVRGYIARNQVEVRVDDLDRLSDVIDAAGTNGATSMSDLRFDLKTRSAVEREALRLAVQDAMGRASAIASGANATVGAIVKIDEQRGMSQPRPMMAMRADTMAMQEASTPVSPGEIEIEARVTLTVGIR